MSLDPLKQYLKDAAPDRIFLLSDSYTSRFTPPVTEICNSVAPTLSITIPSGENRKDIRALLTVTDSLSSNGATRRSLLVNIGGGMVTDLGGFAAAIFKRGIPYINIATTVLAAVDAAIGGKTGVDSLSPEGTVLKNELGAFHKPLHTLIYSEAFSSLPYSELLSGLGEILKTALISSPALYRDLLRTDFQTVSLPELQEWCHQCASFKREVTELDFTEKGLRRILNFGHTAGHALESRLLQRGTPQPHGICIAHGILFAMILSNICLSFSSNEISIYASFLKNCFPPLQLGCKDMPRILSLISHDKKTATPAEQDSDNSKKRENRRIPPFVLLKNIGEPLEAFVPSEHQLLEALDIFRDLC
ncbi:MAG: 3-dehydroquinate synthase [Muribaculaceae bacterium]|nr:3-dehydroquinate synthase [Muribaculaceae bacterium]